MMILNAGWLTISANALLVNLYRNLFVKETVCQYFTHLAKTCTFGVEMQWLCEREFTSKVL